MPDLSTALDLDLGSEEQVLVVPRQCVKFESGNSFVWVKNSGSFEKRQVKTGPGNDSELTVLSGLQEGDIVTRPEGEQP